jgi:hypothetical protein
VAIVLLHRYNSLDVARAIARLLHVHVGCRQVRMVVQCDLSSSAQSSSGYA